VDAGSKKDVSVNYRSTGSGKNSKIRHLWQLMKRYWKARFHFVVKIGLADLRFRNGQMQRGFTVEDFDFEFRDGLMQRVGTPPAFFAIVAEQPEAAGLNNSASASVWCVFEPAHIAGLLITCMYEHLADCLEFAVLKDPTNSEYNLVASKEGKIAVWQMTSSTL
jgi:hypothetical protein